MPLRATPLLAALACIASLSACSDSYDGPWKPLEEVGDWKDPGRLAECSVPAKVGNCGSLSSFDLSGCDLGSLKGLDRGGAIYRAELRYEGSDKAVPGSGGFKFDTYGKLSSVLGMQPTSDSQVSDNTLLLSTAYDPDLAGIEFQLPPSQASSDDRRLSASAVKRFAFVGCKATGPRTFTGCYVECRDTTLLQRATFRAERMTWRAGEAESSGLTLLSASLVDSGKPLDVYVTKGHAYVVSRTRGTYGGLTVFDVSDPRNPVKRATRTLPNDNYWNGVWAKDNALYIASNVSGVLVYDITDPANPVFVRDVPGSTRALDVHTVFVEGDRLYAMSPSNKVTYIFDLADPLRPRLLSTYAYPAPTSIPHDAFAYEGRLYINHGDDGYLVVDAQAEEPRLLGKYVSPHSFSHANAVGTFNGRTVAFEGGENLGAHLRVLDVTNPEGIAKIGEYQLRDLTSIHNMVLVGTRLYVAYYHEGVRVLDVADPTKPREVAHYNTFRESDSGRTDGMFEGAIGMRVPGDGHIYVVDTARGLLIFDEQP